MTLKLGLLLEANKIKLASIAAPVNTVAPALTAGSGSSNVFTYTATTNNGTWTGSPSFTYQWYSSSDGISYATIGGATSASYNNASFAYIKCQVTGTNGGGSASAFSDVSQGAAGFAAITDSFNRADNASSMGNTDTGQTWVPNSGTWGILSNQAIHTVNTSQNTTVVESTVSDCTVQVTVPTVADGGLCVRSTGDSNNLLTSGSADHKLYKNVAGSFTALGDFTSIANGDTIKIVMLGSAFNVYINGALKLTVSDSFNSTATKHGLRENVTGTLWDTFSIVVP